MATFGELLAELRQDRHLTQEQLGKAIYVTAGTISNYENDVHFPDVEKLIALADYFEVTTDYLLGRCSANLSPDTFDKPIAADMTVGKLVETLTSLSPERKHTFLQIVRDMQLSMMVSQYQKRDGK